MFICLHQYEIEFEGIWSHLVPLGLSALVGYDTVMTVMICLISTGYYSAVADMKTLFSDHTGVSQPQVML